MDFLTIEEIKNLDVPSAIAYCDKLRSYLVENVTKSGGHLASNLGVVEISLALIRLFDSPNDKIIYDVGHQSYVHKLLTGRIFDSTNLRKLDGYSGFTKRDESLHDPFGAGHSSTALSAALGFSRAARLKGEDSYSVAVIGDGAFCTGMTFEALNNLSNEDKLIIILNDNEMSISKNVGTMSAYLNRMRTTKKYLTIKRKTKHAFTNLPFIYNGIAKLKAVLKRVLLKQNFFDDLGVYYLGTANGNDLATVETLISEAKNRKGPTLIHFITKKGKGFPEAEENPNKYHFVSQESSPETSFSKEYAALLTEYARQNEKTVAITAAMCDGTGLNSFKNEFPDRLFDVGISEEHAATFAAALSAGGLTPFYTVYSTFFQRSYDQVIHDIALQNLKVIIALDRAGLVGADGATHHGIFDVSMMLSVPGCTIYSPSTYDELKFAFDKCVKTDSLSVLRYPKGAESDVIVKAFNKPSDFSLDVVEKSDVLFVTYGRISEEVLKAKMLLKLQGISSSVLKLVKLAPIDFKSFDKLINAISPKLICVVEEGIKAGGFGEHFVSNINTDVKTEIIAIDNQFANQGTVQELYEATSISSTKIYSRVKQCLK